MPPIISITKQRILLDEGETLEAKCTASGTPKPSITWKRFNGSILTRTGKLIKKNMRPNDSGYYDCTAQNYLGQAKTRLIVFVRGK